jgi:hypothetical protein
VPAVSLVRATVNPLLSVGAGLLAWGFLGGGPTALLTGAAGAALGFLALLFAAGLALTKARGAIHTVRAIRLALGSLFLTLALGLALTGALNGWVPIREMGLWVDAHLAWGLLGWVGLLIMGIAFQVVPMFHVTLPYP